MIFVLAGTQDGRELIGRLLERGYDVAASVVSSYGEQLLMGCQGRRLIINTEPLDCEAMQEYFSRHGIKACVDASHPYAVEASKNAMAACEAAGVPYLRFERNLTELDYDRVTVVHSYEEAARKAAELGRHVFLTTGSRNLQKFTESEALQGCVLTARVLPTAKVIGLCESLGLTPGQIVALQGPFTVNMNKELFRRYQAEVIVTKNSGTLGGTDTKLQAAAELDLPLVVIDRPQLSYPRVAYDFEGAWQMLQEMEQGS